MPDTPDVNPKASTRRESAQGAPVVHHAPPEPLFTRIIEEQIARVPPHIFLVAALGAMGTSAALFATRHREVSRFIGSWAPTLLTLGVYTKVVKLMQSDR